MINVRMNRLRICWTLREDNDPRACVTNFLQADTDYKTLKNGVSFEVLNFSVEFQLVLCLGMMRISDTLSNPFLLCKSSKIVLRHGKFNLIIFLFTKDIEKILSIGVWY